MKLVILTQYYPPEVGAPQARLSQLAQHFVAQGHAVTVLTAMPNYPKGKTYSGYGGVLRRETISGVQVIRTAIYPTQRADFVRRLANYFSFVLSSAVFGTLLLRRCDYMLVESPPLFLGLAGLWLSMLKRARLIFNVSDLWPESAVRMGVLQPNGLACRISSRLEAFLYRKSWLVTGQSKTIIDNVVERFPTCHTFHLSNGVDIRRFSPELSNESASSLIRSNGECIALYAGLHGLAQGLDRVLDALHTLRQEAGLKVVFLGDGPLKPLLLEQSKRLALSNVQFLDQRPAAQIPGIMASADFVLVTLKTYIPGAVPSKLYEGMATARPVILVAEGEAAEIVRRHEAGIVVNPGDVRSLAEAFLTLRSDPGLRRRLGRNGRKAVIRHFNRDLIAARFVKYLEGHLSHLK